MRYEAFRNAIRTELRRIPTGLTWPQLQARLALPYARPCPTRVKRLEQEIGLTRTKVTPPPTSGSFHPQSHPAAPPREGTRPTRLGRKARRLQARCPHRAGFKTNSN